MRPKIKTYRPGDVYRYAHLKRDGIWVTLCSQGCITRHPDGEHDLHEHLEHHPVIKQFFNRGLKARLYCELYAPGKQASQVKSVMLDCPTTLQIECFASPDLSEDASLDAVDVYAEACGVEPIEWYEAVVLDQEWIDEIINKYEDVEGLVFKDGNLLNWAKYKPVLTTDLVIHGYKDGKNGYIGLVGAMICGLADGTVVANVSSGLTLKEREELTDKMDERLGTVCEVAYQYVGTGGRLRHPRFVRFRDDKSPEECTEI